MRTPTIGIAVLLSASAATAQNCTVMETQKLLAETPEGNSDFGYSVDIAGNVLVVGRPEHDLPGVQINAGSAEVWEFDGTQWQRTAVLRADDPTTSGNFGWAVATDGSVIVVGGNRSEVDDNGTALGQAGDVHVFQKIGGVWSSTQYLTSNEPEANGWFGFSLDLDAGGLVVGEPLADYLPNSDTEAGAVHLFLRSGNTFTHADKIQEPDASFRAQLGYDVAVEAGVIFASAPKEDAGFDDRGAVYIFAQDVVWTAIAKLEDGTVDDGFFGEKVEVLGGTVAVGATNQAFSGGSGSVFMYEHAGGGIWNLAQQFNGASTLASDRFGGSIAFMDDTKLAVGASLDDDGGPQTGSLFLFEKQGGTWTQISGPIGNSDRAAGDLFGFDVASDGVRLVSSALGNDDGAFGDGSVHVLDLVCETPCPGDIADDFGTVGSDGMVSFGDFLALLGLVGPCPGGTPGCDGDIADDFGTLNGGDGMVSFGDFLALLGLVGPCP